jgi:hypothetical protein
MTDPIPFKGFLVDGFLVEDLFLPSTKETGPPRGRLAQLLTLLFASQSPQACGLQPRAVRLTDAARDVIALRHRKQGGEGGKGHVEVVVVERVERMRLVAHGGKKD